MDCPEISHLAAFVEGVDVPEVLRAHVQGCDACQESIQSLEEEILSLQIPLSEIWFRDHISCPHGDVLIDHEEGRLSNDAREYVSFHLEELACPHCMGRVEEGVLSRSAEGRQSLVRSRERVGEATSVLLDHFRQKN